MRSTLAFVTVVLISTFQICLSTFLLFLGHLLVPSPKNHTSIHTYTLKTPRFIHNLQPASILGFFNSYVFLNNLNQSSAVEISFPQHPPFPYVFTKRPHLD